MKKKAIQTGYGCIYDKGEHMVAAQWAMDSNVRSSLLHDSPWTHLLFSQDLYSTHLASLIRPYVTITLFCIPVPDTIFEKSQSQSCPLVN